MNAPAPNVENIFSTVMARLVAAGQPISVQALLVGVGTPKMRAAVAAMKESGGSGGDGDGDDGADGGVVRVRTWTQWWWYWPRILCRTAADCCAV